MYYNYKKNYIYNFTTYNFIWFMRIKFTSNQFYLHPYEDHM